MRVIMATPHVFDTFVERLAEQVTPDDAGELWSLARNLSDGGKSAVILGIVDATKDMKDSTCSCTTNKCQQLNDLLSAEYRADFFEALYILQEKYRQALIHDKNRKFLKHAHMLLELKQCGHEAGLI